jgi:hypothetical protein
VDRGCAGPLRQHLGGLRVQAPAAPAREPAVHGAGDQDVHEPQRRDPRPDLSQQPGCLGHVEGVHRVAVGDPGHVDHRAHRELRAQHGGLLLGGMEGLKVSVIDRWQKVWPGRRPATPGRL